MDFLLLGCFLASAITFLLALMYALNLGLRKHNYNAAYKVLCLGTILCAVCYYYPFYLSYFENLGLVTYVKSFFLAIHHAIRLFVVDVNYDELRAFATEFGLLGDFYTGFGIALFLIAPILTFTFIVSFLQNISIVFHLLLNRKAEYYVFTEFNLQSFYLAQDVREHSRKAKIIFLGVDKEKKTEFEKIKSVTRHLYPVLLSLDCAEINRLMVLYRINAKFFLIAEEDEVNSATVISILDDAPRRGNREIYVRLHQTDRLLDNLPSYRNTKVYRIEHLNSLVVHNLEKLGARLFENAKPNPDGGKTLSLLVVGLGGTGSELVKNLAWYTQIEGYTTKIHVFESNKTNIEKFQHRCPGFFGESATACNVQILVHPDMVFGTPAFDRELHTLEDIGFVFVALGSDQLNTNAAFDIRRSLAGADKYPPIQAILRNAHAGELLQSSKNYRGISYDIEFIGSYRELYCLDFITDQQNKEAVIQDFSVWQSLEDVNKTLTHEDQYRIGKARVIHQKLMDQLQVSGERRKRSAHHCWVNLMISEGYVYAPTRNHLAKTNPLLIHYDLLPTREKQFM